MAGNVVRQLTGNGSGQSFNDIITSAKLSFTGSNVAKIICKATTEELQAPKLKHLECLKSYTMDPMLSVPEFSNFLLNRLRHSNWVVVFKALITIHHLMHYGNDKFSEYLASCYSTITVPNIIEKYERARQMNALIQVYTHYLSEKSKSYQLAGCDFCKIKRGKPPADHNKCTERAPLEYYDNFAPISEEKNLRKMSENKLFKTIPILEMQLDSLIKVQFTNNELKCPIVLAAHLLMYKDLIRLYAVYNEGMINLIDKFFNMDKRKKCEEAMKLFNSYIVRLDKLNNYVKQSEEANLNLIPKSSSDQSVIFQPVSETLIDSLKAHMDELDDKGRIKMLTIPQPTSDSLHTVNSQKVNNDQLLDDFLQNIESAITKTEEHKSQVDIFSLDTGNNPFASNPPMQPAIDYHQTVNNDILDIFGTTPSTRANNPFIDMSKNDHSTICSFTDQQTKQKEHSLLEYSGNLDSMIQNIAGNLSFENSRPLPLKDSKIAPNQKEKSFNPFVNLDNPFI